MNTREKRCLNTEVRFCELNFPRMSAARTPSTSLCRSAMVLFIIKRAKCLEPKIKFTL